MLSAINFFLVDHDIRLVIVAAVICMLSAYGCVGLLRHSHKAEGKMRLVWTSVAAIAVGFGIWATHFVAMMAFRAGFPLSYDFGMTAASLAIAIVVCGMGVAVASRGTSKWDHFLGGAVVGVAISSMHYTGIFALVMGGELRWNAELIVISIIAGMVFGGLSFVCAMGKGHWRLLGGAALLTAAICFMHFTAMSAADFSRCFPLSTNNDIDGPLMSVILAGISLVILACAVGSALLDEADRRRTERELQRQNMDAARIATVTHRLELALTNMAQGLTYYGADGNLEIYNKRVPAILGIDPNRDLTGLSFRDVLRLAILGTGVPAGDLEVATERQLEQHRKLIDGEGGELTYKFSGDKTLLVVHSPVGDGSWVSTIEDITERQRTQNKIAHLARHDVLTGLPNRATFEERFDLLLFEADESDNNIAVIAIDLDGFKDINDSHGHQAGDHVLQNLAKRLTAGLKEGEMIARLGGDEFAALKSFQSMDSLREFLARIENALFTRMEMGHSTVTTGASIGVAIYPEDGDDRSKLLNNADLAMYRAKADFDLRVCYYESEMDEHARQRRAMAKGIWNAIDNDDFYLVYQVQKSVATGEVTGYEVLLRWEWEGHGNISPADFIPVAEEFGSILAIGNWVLRTATKHAAKWPEPHKIAVNVSGVQLAQGDLVENVRLALDRSGLDPSRLELEVTETSIISDKQRALYSLRQIKEMGVSIAIDDFGTGYSSLETLRSFPWDKIKLDRSFMDEVEVNEQSKAIVRAILALGRSLSVPVLAEGVETSAQLDVLRAEGCNEAQGFLLGRPGVIDWDDLLEPRMLA